MIWGQLYPVGYTAADIAAAAAEDRAFAQLVWDLAAKDAAAVAAENAAYVAYNEYLAAELAAAELATQEAAAAAAAAQAQATAAAAAAEAATAAALTTAVVVTGVVLATLAFVGFAWWWTSEMDAVDAEGKILPFFNPPPRPPGFPALGEVLYNPSWGTPGFQGGFPVTPAIDASILGLHDWTLPSPVVPPTEPGDLGGGPGQRTWDGGLHIESAGKFIGGFTPGVTEGSHPVLGSVLDFISTEKGLISIWFNQNVGETGMWQATAPADNPEALWILPDITQVDPNKLPVGKFISWYDDPGVEGNWFVTAL